MAEYVLRFRAVAPDELLSEEEVLHKDPNHPFLSISGMPEPYRSYRIARARLEPVFQREKVQSPFIAETPRGRGLIWRYWSNQVGVVLMKPAASSNGLTLEEKVTFLTPQESQHVKLVLDQIVLNPPDWR
jgi:hypothetical protein